MIDLRSIPRSYRHLHRYHEILGVLFKYGFGDVVGAIGVEQALEAGLHAISKNWSPETLGLSRPVRVRRAMEELGPTFVKAGQFLATRSDLLPPEYLQELGKLLDQGPLIPMAAVDAALSEELPGPRNARFSRFNPKPLAAASIAQIHRATLTSGEPVVVKIRRPSIQNTITVDLEILRHLASLAERHLDEWKWRRPTLVVDELARTLERELDFTLEASSMERFARDFASDPSVYVPRVYREYTSPRVLTMEYVDAIRVDDLAGLRAAGLEPRKIARRLVRHFLRQIFVHGFFHADPHPGNIFVLRSGAVAYLDFGMTGHLDQHRREDLGRLLRGIVDRDETAVVDALMRLVIPIEEPDRPELEKEVMDLLDQHLYRPVRELRLGVLLQRVFAVSSRRHLRVPPELFLMIKAVGNLETLMRVLDPDLDVVGASANFLRAERRRRLRPGRLLREAADGVENALRSLRSAPAGLADLFDRIRRGRFSVVFEHRGLDATLSTLDRITNRIAFAILVGSLVVGSSLIVVADTPPLWHSLPVVGLAGYLLAAMMAIWLLVSILRHGRM